MVPNEEKTPTSHARARISWGRGSGVPAGTPAGASACVYAFSSPRRSRGVDDLITTAPNGAVGAQGARSALGPNEFGGAIRQLPHLGQLESVRSSTSIVPFGTVETGNMRTSRAETLSSLCGQLSQMGQLDVSATKIFRCTNWYTWRAAELSGPTDLQCPLPSPRRSNTVLASAANSCRFADGPFWRCVVTELPFHRQLRTDTAATTVAGTTATTILAVATVNPSIWLWHPPQPWGHPPQPWGHPPQPLWHLPQSRSGTLHNRAVPAATEKGHPPQSRSGNVHNQAVPTATVGAPSTTVVAPSTIEKWHPPQPRGT